MVVECQIGWKCKCGHSLLHDFNEGYLHLIPLKVDNLTLKMPPQDLLKEFLKAERQCPHCSCNTPCPAPMDVKKKHNKRR